MKTNTVITTRLAVCPIRVRPDETSEMVTQLLFGEKAVVIDKKKESWLKISLHYDGYEGWIDSKMVISSTMTSDHPTSYSVDTFGQVFSDERSTWISLGSDLPLYDGMMCELGGTSYRFSGQAIKASDAIPSGERIEKIAKKLVNAPYLWGGRTPLGIDCSGFTQLIYKCTGVKIKRDAKDQALQGEMIDFVSQSKLGDLAFFSKKTEKITHVGIILDDQSIIHASGRVRIDTLDHYGIFNEEIQEYTHRLKIIRRYF